METTQPERNRKPKPTANSLKHLVRTLARAVRIANGDAVGAKARGDGRAFAFGYILEVQVTDLRGGVHDGAGGVPMPCDETCADAYGVPMQISSLRVRA
jgi:hypothetical protein